MAITKREARMIAEELYAMMERDKVFEDKFLSAPEAAALLGIPLSTLYSRVSGIPHTKVGKHLRFSERALRQYMYRK